MLNTSKVSGYKTLARKTEFRECISSDNPISELVVDFRSRLFMYIRTKYMNRHLNEKIGSVFRAMNNLVDEKMHVFNASLALARGNVAMMGVHRCTYVFASPITCPYKEGTKLEREPVVATRREELDACMQAFRNDMLNMDALDACITALESYIIADLDSVCSVYSGMEWLLVPEAYYAVPGRSDLFESDRLCARLGKTSAVLSEDFDCIALFGANLMVKEVFRGFFSYTTLSDVMETFGSTTRSNLAERCCLMGTDYNYGLKGIGPVKAVKIDSLKASELWITCISAQSIPLKAFRNFLLLH